MTVEYSISGLDELRGKLRALSSDTQRKGGRAALRKAAQIVRDAARRNAEKLDDPKTGRMISKNIVERWNGRRNKRTGGAEIGFRVGVLGGARAELNDKARRKTDRRRARLGQTSLDELGEIAGAGKNNPGGDTFYWRFLEFGTEKMDAQPLMRHALEHNVQAATDEFVRAWTRSADRAIKRAQKASS